jgi:hypothetical protein
MNDVRKELADFRERMKKLGFVPLKEWISVQCERLGKSRRCVEMMVERNPSIRAKRKKLNSRVIYVQPVDLTDADNKTPRNGKCGFAQAIRERYGSITKGYGHTLYMRAWRGHDISEFLK